MHSRYRLSAPAAAFALIGTMLLLTPDMGFQLRGGLATSGSYALALQVVLALLLLAVIDDLHDPQPPTTGYGGHSASPPDPAFDIRQALMHFYAWKPVPMSFAAFGLATSLTAIAIGLFDRPGVFRFAEYPGMALRHSEIVMGTVIVAMALLQLRKARWGYFGWCVGTAVGTAAAEIQMDPEAQLSPTVIGWSAFAAALSLVGLVASAGIAQWRRRRVS